MSDPLARLHKLDQRRTILYTYSQRIKLARLFAPATERRMQARISARFHAITLERRQLLELIKADPVLRRRHLDHEQRLSKVHDETTRKEYDR